MTYGCDTGKCRYNEIFWSLNIYTRGIYICIYIYVFAGYKYVYKHIYMHITNINVCVRKCGIPPRLLFKYAVIVMWILIHLIWWSLGCPIFRETLVGISDVISDAMNRFFPGNFTIFTSVFWQIRTGDTSGNRKPYEETSRLGRRIPHSSTIINYIRCWENLLLIMVNMMVNIWLMMVNNG